MKLTDSDHLTDLIQTLLYNLNLLSQKSGWYGDKILVSKILIRWNTYCLKKYSHLKDSFELYNCGQGFFANVEQFVLTFGCIMFPPTLNSVQWPTKVKIR